ncbi:MAG: glycosyltransferase family 4 protein [Cytophagales bacterium]|nr:glycosyltransferase family 4 protein [Cytophagales bacterium]
MRIGFDAKRVFTNFTGLGNYSRFVIHILSKYYPDNEHILYSPVVKVRNGNGHDLTQQIASLIERSNITIRTINSIFKPGREGGWKSPGGFRGDWWGSYWRTFALARLVGKNQYPPQGKKGMAKSPLPRLHRDRRGDLGGLPCDIYHGLTNELPVGIGKAKLKSVVTIHDLVFLRHPELYPWIDRKIYQFKCKHACTVADKIIAVSEQTKSDIIEFYGTDPRKIEVVYQSCDQAFKQSYSENQLQEVKRKYKLPQNYILNVGRIEKRKNALVILRALKILKDKHDIPLVIVGKPTPYKKELTKYAAKNGLSDSVLFIDNISFSDLPPIYQMAKLFIYPSLFEGFGIPILEALYSGVPVVTSKGSCFGEVAGPSSLYISPGNALELSEAIIKILFNESLAIKMVKEGRAYTRKFDEKKLAGDLVKIYEKL